MADHIYNTEYAMKEFTMAGEIDTMNKLKKYPLNMIFDVGANIGEWAKMARSYQPKAEIHSFEPVPSVFKTMVKNTIDYDVMPNPFGLSSACEIRDMLFSADNDRLTTPCLELQREQPEVVPLVMLGGDDYCRTRRIESIDFLKIDTEGHEFQVLKGFNHMLTAGKIAVIQFEYGYANVLTKDLLIDFYKLLKPLGYSIGIQTEQGVAFRDYTLLHENFNGPNYVAVHSTAPDFVVDLQI